MFGLPIGAGLVVVLLAIFFLNWIKILNEYERGVIFRLGRVQGAKGPGLFFIIPVIDRMVKVDLRTVTLDVPAQVTGYSRAGQRYADLAAREAARGERGDGERDAPRWCQHGAVRQGRGAVPRT